MPKRIASLDLGSNSFLLSIAEIERGKPTLILDECRVVGLVKKLENGKVGSEAIERAKEALKEYRSILESHSVEEIKIVATESLRKPSNAQEVKGQLEQVIGQSIELISGQREAELSFWSVQNEYPKDTEQKIVFDIGGASTELVLGGPTGIEVSDSLKMGSVTLTEEFGLSEPSIYDDALRFALDKIKSSEAYQTSQDRQTTGVGVAGTMTVLIACQRSLKEFKREEVHLHGIKTPDVMKWMKRVTRSPLTERYKITGLPQNRADVFGGGCIIAYALAKAFDWEILVCMDAGVRLGLLWEEAKKLES